MFGDFFYNCVKKFFQIYMPEDKLIKLMYLKADQIFSPQV